MEKLVVAKIKKFIRSVRSGPVWQSVFSKDWLLKSISLMIAVVIWYVIGREDMVDKIVMVPIEIINMPRDLVVANQFKKEIEVTLSGPRAAIEDMTSRSVTRQINLSSASPGTSVIVNGKDSIPVPRGITVLRIQPSSIILSLDKLVQKQYPIAPITKGEVAQGFQLEYVKLDPANISITGPQTVLSQVDELRTKIIDLGGLSTSKQMQVPLDLSPEIVELIGETSITASIEIAVKSVEKIFTKIEIGPLIDGKKYKLSPESADVVLKIPVNLIKKGVEPRSLFSLSGELLYDNETVKLQVVSKEDTPQPLEVVSIFPPTVKLEKEKTVTKQDSLDKDDVQAQSSPVKPAPKSTGRAAKPGRQQTTGRP